MDELTIGQKAKLYDEVVNKLKGFMAQGVDPLITRADVQDFFPELKGSTESEDERIRKELIAFLKENLETGRADETWSMSGLERWIAWLEKQGEQKEYTFKSLPRLLDMIEPTSKAKAYCQKLIDALVKEGYTTDAKIVGECLKAMNGENVPMAIMDEKQGEQNLAWSEEDEENFARVDYACLKVYGGDSYSSDWLRKILGIHKKWKPSEEQMKVLDAAVMHSHLTTAEYDGLVKLREQLKKLREE